MVLRRPSGFIEPCLPSKVARPPSGPLWVHEIKHDGLYEASRVKKFFEINIFSFPAFQEASRRVSAVLR